MRHGLISCYLMTWDEILKSIVTVCFLSLEYSTLMFSKMEELPRTKTFLFLRVFVYPRYHVDCHIR